MKQLNKMSLLLPHNVSLEVFMELVNKALEQSDYNYDLCSWDEYDKKVISNEINSCWFRLVPIRSEQGELVLEFDRNWKDEDE
jgi:hypothetical protein